MAETFIIKVVKENPKEWQSKYGPMLTYLIQVEGNGEPVEINKKVDKDGNVVNPPKVGAEIYGTINETEFGQKFKPEQKPFDSSKSGGYSESPERQDSINRAVALNNAVLYANAHEIEAHDAPAFDVLEQADIFLAWLKNDVKPENQEPLTAEKVQSVADKASAWKKDPPSKVVDPDEEVVEGGDEWN